MASHLDWEAHMFDKNDGHSCPVDTRSRTPTSSSSYSCQSTNSIAKARCFSFACGFSCSTATSVQPIIE
ncbi:hypothetical protein ACHAW6_015519 [Cyclotella cf. meneghiniana]